MSMIQHGIPLLPVGHFTCRWEHGGVRKAQSSASLQLGDSVPYVSSPDISSQQGFFMVMSS